MSVLIQVDYGSDYPDRVAIISGSDEEAFIQFAQNPIAKAKEGEELIELLITHLSTNIEEVSRYRKKVREDGPQGQPHRQKFRQGRLHLVEHYKNDRKNDSQTGEPAVQVYRWDGKSSQLSHSARYQNGLSNNGANGEPSMLSFNDKGALVWQVSCKDDYLINDHNEYPASARWHDNGQPQKFEWVDEKGQYHDGIDGQPAIQKWDVDGQEIYRASYAHGQLLEEITTESPLEKELKEFRDNQIAMAKQLCPALKFKIDQGVMRVASI
ncbi:hypothetical protein [Owenweeksia hongkongensis]|uniref:hypothetical protein n=1 Tax=Owenweeksia hongkongensis TaxID=253245 RepID=UPI003A92869C